MSAESAEMHKNTGISANDKSIITNANFFLRLYDADWKIGVAKQTSQNNKCNFQKLLPLFSNTDISK